MEDQPTEARCPKGCHIHGAQAKSVRSPRLAIFLEYLRDNAVGSAPVGVALLNIAYIYIYNMCVYIYMFS